MTKPQNLFNQLFNCFCATCCLGFNIWLNIWLLKTTNSSTSLIIAASLQLGFGCCYFGLKILTNSLAKTKAYHVFSLLSLAFGCFFISSCFFILNFGLSLNAWGWCFFGLSLIWSILRTIFKSIWPNCHPIYGIISGLLLFSSNFIILTWQLQIVSIWLISALILGSLSFCLQNFSKTTLFGNFFELFALLSWILGFILLVN